MKEFYDTCVHVKARHFSAPKNRRFRPLTSWSFIFKMCSARLDPLGIPNQIPTEFNQQAYIKHNPNKIFHLARLQQKQTTFHKDK